MTLYDGVEEEEEEAKTWKRSTYPSSINLSRLFVCFVVCKCVSVDVHTFSALENAIWYTF